MDKYILPIYFPNAVLNKNLLRKTKLPANGSGEEILSALLTGAREPVVVSKNSDIYEAYLVAKMGGYLDIMEIFISKVDEMISSKLKV